MSATTATRRYVFLASSAYSGSTLLSYLLAAHPRVATVSDVSGARRAAQMQSFECSCGARMVECPFWTELGGYAARRGVDDLDLADFRLGFDHHSAGPLAPVQARSLRWSALESVRDMALAPLGTWRTMSRIGERTWAFANAVLDLEDADVFVDASKERLRIRNLRRHLPTAPLVIHLVRDVRGVVDSTLRRGKEDRGPEQIARGWARTNDSIVRQLAELPATQWLRVRYEDLCANVDDVMRGVFQFCGADPDLSLQPLGADVHLLGNRMRLDAPSEVALDERWRESLSPDIQASVLRAAGKTFRMLYPERAAIDGRRQ